MDFREKVFEIAEGALINDSYFLVDVKVSAGNKKIAVLVDGDKGVKIDDCAKMSRQIGEQLDTILEGSYTLDVSSPGVDQPLKLHRQYLKNVGRPVKIKLLDGNVIKGDLLNAGEDNIIVQNEKKDSKEEIKLKDIDWTKVRVSFK